MTPPVKVRFGLEHLVILGPTSQYGVDTFTPRADNEDPFAPFLQLKTCCEGGSLIFDLLWELNEKRGKRPTIILCAASCECIRSAGAHICYKLLL